MSSQHLMQPREGLKHLACTTWLHQLHVCVLFCEYEYPLHDEHLALNLGTGLLLIVSHAFIGRISEIHSLHIQSLSAVIICWASFLERA